jgi:hypothetical protein
MNGYYNEYTGLAPITLIKVPLKALVATGEDIEEPPYLPEFYLAREGLKGIDELCEQELVEECYVGFEWNVQPDGIMQEEVVSSYASTLKELFGAKVCLALLNAIDKNKLICEDWNEYAFGTPTYLICAFVLESSYSYAYGVKEWEGYSAIIGYLDKDFDRMDLDVEEGDE